MLEIDGSLGEGGGQVLRSSLSLAAATGMPFRIRNVRAGRREPGLLRQHLTSVRAAAAICGAEVRGAELRSSELEFRPGALEPVDLELAIGSSGSAMLVLQTVLPPLLLAGGESTVRVHGGTHNPWAPPFEALAWSFLPLLERIGARLELELEGYGFLGAGGGTVVARVRPFQVGAGPVPLELTERGEPRSHEAVVLHAHLPREIAERELEELATNLGADFARRIDEIEASPGPGNVLHVVLRFEHVTEVFTAFGMKGVSGKRLAREVAAAAQDHLRSGHAVGPHLADQLLVPLALGAGGTFRTGPPTRHTRTNADVVNLFLGERVGLDESPAENGGGTLVRVEGR